MPTFVFKQAATGKLKRAQAHALNAARDKIPEAYDATEWLEWECWFGGQCIWHIDDKGNCVSGSRKQ